MAATPTKLEFEVDLTLTEASRLLLDKVNAAAARLKNAREKEDNMTPSAAVEVTRFGSRGFTISASTQLTPLVDVARAAFNIAECTGAKEIHVDGRGVGAAVSDALYGLTRGSESEIVVVEHFDGPKLADR